MRELEQNSDEAPSLPRTGADLSDVVSVIPKTNEESSPDTMARFIHEARVRRSVVVKLITDAKARGHRAYRKVDLVAMRQKTESLPEDGVPGWRGAPELGAKGRSALQGGRGVLRLGNRGERPGRHRQIGR